MFSTAYAAGATWNDTRWSHELFNELLVPARSELDDAKRRQLYYELQEIVSNEGGGVVPMFANYVMGLSQKIHHEKLGASASIDALRRVERWWFA